MCTGKNLNSKDEILVVIRKCQQIIKLLMGRGGGQGGGAHTFTNLTYSFQEGVLIAFNELHLISWKWSSQCLH